MNVPCAPLDYETRLFQGCGASELYSIAVFFACTWLPFALFLGFAILDGLHAVFFAFAVFVFGVMIYTALVARVLKELKFGKPEGWHLRWFYCSIHPYLCSNLIYHSGRWSTVRECQT